MKETIKENYKQYILLFLISLVLCASLFASGFFYAHDVEPHVARVTGTVSALKDGQLIPLVAPNFGNGFGFSWNLFYGPLFSYLSVIFGLITANIFTGMKIVTFLTIFVSAITMYNFILYATKSKNLALLVGIIYICAPYRLSEVFTRFAAGEMMAFVFFPLVFHGLYSLFREDGKKHYLLAIGLSGIIVSHNISAILMVILMFLYILVNIKEVLKKEIFIKLSINACFVILLSAFYIFPFIQTSNATEYKLLQPTGIGTTQHVKNHTAFLSQLLIGEIRSGGYSTGLAEGINNEMSFAIGIFIIIPILFTPFIFKEIPINKRKDYIFLIVIGIISIFLCSTYFPWGRMPSAFGIIQFPWRFLMFIVFTFSIVSAINIKLLIKDFNMMHVLFLLVIIFAYIRPMLLPIKSNWMTDYDKFYEVDVIKEDDAYTIGTANFDYFPVKASNNIEYVANRSQEPIVLNGDADILDVNKTGTKLDFWVNSSKANTIIELPYIYYVGYNIKLIDKNKNITKLTGKESDNGFLAIEIPEINQGKIEIKYTGTLLCRIAYIISLVGLVVFIIYCIKQERRD